MTDSSDNRLNNQSSGWFSVLPEAIQCSLEAIPASDSYFVAFSGGLDSSLLLELTHRYLLEFRQSGVTAIHVHHGLSVHADQWLSHCESVCQRLSIPLIAKQVKLSSNKKGLEDAARTARYSVFEQVLPEGAILLQGHHQNDQAETVLLRLMRGAGVAGVAGIPLTRMLNAALIHRPFLNISKQTLLQLAQSLRLEWVEDDSNESRDYDRNFIRHEIIPLLESRWKGAVGRLYMTANHCRESSELEDELAKIDLKAVFHDRFSSVLSIEALSQLSRVRQINAVRYWMRTRHMGFPGEKKFRRIWSEVFSARDDAAPVVEWALGSIRRYRGGLFLVSKHEQKIQSQFNSKEVIPLDVSTLKRVVTSQSFTGSAYSVMCINESDENSSTSGLCVRMPNKDEKVTLRFRQGGETFKSAGSAHHKPLKKWLHDSFIPPWLRDSVPLLYYNECLVAVGDCLVADGAQKTLNECALCIEWEMSCVNGSIVKY